MNPTAAPRADLEGRFAGPLTPRQRNRVPVLLRADAEETDADSRHVRAWRVSNTGAAAFVRP